MSFLATFGVGMAALTAIALALALTCRLVSPPTSDGARRRK